MMKALLPAAGLLDILKAENPTGLKWDSLPMPGETHRSIQFSSLEAGLRALVWAKVF